MHPEIKTLPELRLACLRHTGPLGGESVARHWRRFAIWAGNAGLLAPDRRVLGITRDQLGVTPPPALRYDACVEVAPEFEPSGDVFVDVLPGGGHACIRFDGDPTRIAVAWQGAIAHVQRLEAWQIDPRPMLEWYDRGLELDIKGRFSCLLCIPVRPR